MSDSAENFFASAPQNSVVEDNWSLFKTTLTKAMVNYIPQRRSSMKYKLPWITSEITPNAKERSIAQEGSSLSATRPLGGV